MIHYTIIYNLEKRGLTMEKNIFDLIQLHKLESELSTIVSRNEATSKFGLSLTNEDAHELVLCRNESLKKYQRVEFGSGILDKLIYTFCDSQYISQNNYLETLEKLQDIFYEFKNESLDKITDDELLTFMKEQFDSVCFGDLDYLESTCLARFSKAIRAGYDGFKETAGHNEYENLSEEERWSSELYMDIVKELFWS